MIAVSPEDIVDLRRWAICGAVIVLAHGVAGVVTWQDPDESAEPAAAIVIEFAPVPVAPAVPQMEIPPGPEQVMSDASPSNPTDSLEEKIEEKIERAAAYLGIAGGFDGFRAAIMALREKLAIPANLTAMGVDPARLDELTEMALEDPSCGGNPIAMTRENTRALFGACM